MDPRLEKLIKTLEKLIERQESEDHDPEFQHEAADKALVEYINDERVAEVFFSLRKWYA